MLGDSFDEWWATTADTMGVALNEVEEPKAKALALAAYQAATTRVALECDLRAAYWAGEVAKLPAESPAARLASSRGLEASRLASAIRGEGGEGGRS